MEFESENCRHFVAIKRGRKCHVMKKDVYGQDYLDVTSATEDEFRTEEKEAEKGDWGLLLKCGVKYGNI